MFSLTYVSSAGKPFELTELRALLNHCNRNNQRLNVTGMLLYKEGNFMQALEGDEAVVKALHATISCDPRHRGLITLLQGPIPTRQFPGWSMGFRDLNSDSPHPQGYSEFMNAALTGKEFTSNPSQAQRLLQTFKSIM